MQATITSIMIEQFSDELGAEWEYINLESAPERKAEFRYVGADAYLRGASIICLAQIDSRLCWKGWIHTPEKVCLTEYLYAVSDKKDLYASIAQSATKTSKAIIADVKRRLLPKYLSAYKLGMLAYEERRKASNEDRGLSECLAAEMKGQVLNRDDCKLPITVYPGSKFHFSTMEIYAGTVTVRRLTLTPEQAWQLVDLMSSWA